MACIGREGEVEGDESGETECRKGGLGAAAGVAPDADGTEACCGENGGGDKAEAEEEKGGCEERWGGNRRLHGWIQ